MVDSNNSNSPEAVRQVNWEAVCTIDVIEEVVDDVHGDMDGIDAMVIDNFGNIISSTAIVCQCKILCENTVDGSF